jgi:protein-S-isoprenylcysteine O-methyltransferase Ste14
MLIIVYFIVLTIYGFAEIALQKWFSKQKSQKPDAGLALIIIPFYAALYFAPLEYLLFKPGIHIATILVGYFLLLLGVFMRLIGLMALRQNFSMAIECKDETLLVTTGIYKYVRHPLYLATILLASSGCLIFSSIFCWIFFVITIYGIVKRIKKEELFLNKQFSEYQRYSKQSKKLIPFIY